MEKVSAIDLDVAKHIFQVDGVDRRRALPMMGWSAPQERHHRCRSYRRSSQAADDAICRESEEQADLQALHRVPTDDRHPNSSDQPDASILSGIASH
ncbi:hypothetical protein [Mesorhizobium sp. LCM 4577]|uniref:hypothetical protein n=1 Tax=Mesorhizobium sp. LCM 4577 TaxID=1848288 RepID=UPI00352B18F2